MEQNGSKIRAINCLLQKNIDIDRRARGTERANGLGGLITSAYLAHPPPPFSMTAYRSGGRERTAGSNIRVQTYHPAPRFSLTAIRSMGASSSERCGAISSDELSYLFDVRSSTANCPCHLLWTAVAPPKGRPIAIDSHRKPVETAPVLDPTVVGHLRDQENT